MNAARKRAMDGSFLFRAVMLTCLLLSGTGALAQSAVTQQFMSMSPSEREQMMQQFGLTPDDVLSAVREGAGRAGAAGRAGSDGGSDSGSTQGGLESRGVTSGEYVDRFYRDPSLGMFGEMPPAQPVYDPNDTSLVGSIDYAERYGLEAFSEGHQALQEILSIPVPPDYVVGPGDAFTVSLYGKESAQYYLNVTREGWIDFPELGPIQVAGLSFREAREHVAARVREQKIGLSVSVSLEQLKSLQVMVSGEVYRPGTYVVPSLVSIVQVLSMAGGITDVGSMRDVAIIREGERIDVDLYDYVLEGNSAAVHGLRSGDAIHVPAVRSAVQVKGAVRRPTVYELREGESIADLIEMAGGLSPGAAPSEAVVRRYRKSGHPELLNVDLNAEDAAAEPATDGMILMVPRASVFSPDRIELTGEVPSPGVRQWRPGLMLSDLIGDLSRDVRIRRADLEYAYLVRTDPDSRAITFLDFAPRAIARGETDIELRPEDEVIILPLPGLVEARQAGGAFDDEENAGSERDPEEGANRPNGEFESNAVAATGSAERPARDVNQRASFASTQAYTDRGLRNARTRRLQEEDVRESRSRAQLLEPHLERLSAQTRDGSRVPHFMVAGEVQAPGTYPITQSSSFSGALLAAGGLKETANTQRAVVLRKPSPEASLEVLEIPMDDLRAAGGPRDLKPGDVITIGRDPSLANRVEVEISGQIASPGSYVLPPGSTISDLMEIAGGVTPRADLRSAVFSRARLREMEDRLRARYIAEIRKNLIDAEVAGDTRSADPAVLQLLDELQSALDEQSDGRLQVDLPRLAAGDETANLALSTGDRLTIPAETGAVSVAGQVRAAGSFAHVPGMSAESYLEMAGGLSNYADDDAVFIVRADGAVERLDQRSWLRFDRTQKTLLPGDRIVVPIDTDYVNRFDLLKEIVQFTYQTGIGLAAVVAALQ